MPNYRRLLIPGGTYFFTVNLARRGTTLLTDNIDLLRAAYRTTMATMPVRCHAMVILPDHLHAVWTLPPNDDAFGKRWRKVKTRFTRAVTDDFPRTASKHRKRERGVWQRRYWEHAIRSEGELQAYVRYCWINPVKHGLVARPSDWRFSSIQGAINDGDVSADWAG